ncbi:MAG: FHA domain-containing protein [Gemmataceae bacterium]|nr:FHA domain-containing protein [Gemmataceae bacterium]
MPPQLLALTEGPNILLDKPILLLGRHQECDIQLASRKISRRHCCIAQVNDYLVVRDLCSTNGIRINGIRVVEGALREGDELTIGNHRYQVLWNAHSSEPAAINRPPVPGKEAIRRTRHVPMPEDAQLESCEEPIALAEPGSHVNAVPVLPSAPVEPPPALEKARPPRPPNSLVFPSEVNLAPLSDVANPPPAVRDDDAPP